MSKYLYEPPRILYADETDVSCVHSNHLKVRSVKGKEQVGKLISGERERERQKCYCTACHKCFWKSVYSSSLQIACGSFQK